MGKTADKRISIIEEWQLLHKSRGCCENRTREQERQQWVYRSFFQVQHSWTHTSFWLSVSDARNYGLFCCISPSGLYGLRHHLHMDHFISPSLVQIPLLSISPTAAYWAPHWDVPPALSPGLQNPARPDPCLPCKAPSTSKFTHWQSCM